jgi:outer membrane protein assembly factor BamB
LLFMKKLLIALMLVAAVFTPLFAADTSRLLSNPTLLPVECLDRLRLKMAWTATVPMQGRRDGLFSAQLLPGEKGPELLVQTRSGGVMSYDATTGVLRWATRVGTPFRLAQPLAYNHDTLFAISNIDLVALDRATGRLLWEFDLPSGAAAPPGADEDSIYVSMTNGRVAAYTLPNPALEAKLARQGKAPDTATAPQAAHAVKGIDLHAIGPLSGVHEGERMPHLGLQPVERYSYISDERVEQAPVPTRERVLLAGVGGEIMAIAKGGPKLAWRPIYARGKIMVPVGQYDETAYVASNDATVYAISIASGRGFWRSSVGGVPTDRPAALDEDIYVAADRAGVVRLDRGSGEERWRNEEATRYLASNKTFVYAADRHGRLLILDRARGNTLSSYDGTRDFVFPVQNDLTDRVYLAANNGLIVCLHDRDAATPVVMKTIKERSPLPAPGGAKPAPREPGDENGGAKSAPKEPKDEGAGAKPKAPGGAMEKP